MQQGCEAILQHHQTMGSLSPFKKVDYHFLMTGHHCWIISIISKSVELVRVQKCRQICLYGWPQLKALLLQLLHEFLTLNRLLKANWLIAILLNKCSVYLNDIQRTRKISQIERKQR